MLYDHKVKMTFSLQINDEFIVKREVEFIEKQSLISSKIQAAEIIKQLESLKLRNEIDEELGLSRLGSTSAKLA